MDESKKFYITTAIDYVNAAPHIGHAYEKIATDVLARHFKQRNYEVFFLTGSDEHGIKIEKTSREKGISPQQFCDEISQLFKDAWKLLDIDYDRYIRTTEADHKTVVQHIFKTLAEKGDIYKASYTGQYCSGCESFLNERDLTEEGLCPDHKVKPEEVKEENYFFKLTKYKDRIKTYIESHVMPDYRVNELLNQLKDMEDFSVSRSKDSVSWGISVPDDDSQVIYVWIDALSNYLTGVGYLKNEELFNKFWTNNDNVLHMIGKDILKFHSIYWIGILMAMELKVPEKIFAHGWITVDQTKMSKSLGNVIAPKAVLDAYNLETPDAFRYFMMTTTPFGRDGNYSDEDFKGVVNADLANNLGNLLNRTLSMLVKYFDGEIKQEFITSQNENELAGHTHASKELIKESFDGYKISDAADHIIILVDRANKYVNEKAPWGLAKEEKMTECGQVLYNVLETLRQVAVMIYPFTPNISQDMWQQLGQNGNVCDVKYDDLKWGDLQAGKIASAETVKPVFLRLESELAGEDKKKK
jgi:methionyl-tRNA synthetase